jgi:hypothetical protein
MKSRSSNPSRGLLSLLAAVLILSIAIWSGCSNENAETVTGPGFEKPSLELSVANPAIRAVMDVQNRHTPELMGRPGVVGTATSVDENGQPFITVYTVERLPKGDLPASIDGVPVVAEVSGVIRAMKGKPGGGGGVSHTAKQTAPVKMGTSGGWRYDLANGYCCGGTLGSVITKGGKKYVMSNYHVLEADIVSGGNSRTAQAGDPVIQPGLIDVNCSAASAQNVASLSGIKSLPGSNVDVAIAEVIPGMVDESGDILEVGVISSQTANAFVGQAVKKSGRTTGLTRSSVSGLNATISVSYENECAGGSAFTKTFTGQIIIANKRSKFLGGGDSGSLMVEDVSTSPRAVGLLFAGSSTLAVANPIGEVLSYLNASMVGN